MSYHYGIDFERHNLYDLCFYVTSSLILPGGEFHTAQYLFGHHSRHTAAQTIQNNMCAQQYIPFMTKFTCSQVHMLLKMNITQESQHRLGTYNNFSHVVCNMSLFLQQCALWAWCLASEPLSTQVFLLHLPIIAFGKPLAGNRYTSAPIAVDLYNQK